MTPEEVGEMSTLSEGPSTVTAMAGALALGVTTVPAGEGGVGLPVEASVPVAETAWAIPGVRPVRGQFGEAHVAMTGAPLPAGTAVRV